MSSPLPQSRARVQRIAEAAVERARLTVVPRVRARTPRVPFVTLISLLLLGGVVGLLMLNTTMQQNSFTANALETRADQLAAQQQGLQMELDELSSPQRVAEQAAELGMVRGTAPAFIDLRSGKITAGNVPPADAESRAPFRTPETQKPRVLAPPPKVKYVDAPQREKRNRDTAAASSSERSTAGSNEGASNARQGDRSNR